MRRSGKEKTQGVYPGEPNSWKESRNWWDRHKLEIPPEDPVKEKEFEELLFKLCEMNWGSNDMERVRAAAWAVGICGGLEVIEYPKPIHGEDDFCGDYVRGLLKAMEESGGPFTKGYDEKKAILDAEYDERSGRNLDNHRREGG